MVKKLELTNKMAKDKLILIKGDLIAICNYQREIFLWQDQLLLLNKNFWLEPVAKLFDL